MGRTKSESHLARNLAIGFAVLLVLYTLAGFLVLPWWLEKSVPEQLEQRMGWQAGVSEVAFNPFSLQLEVADFEARDGAEEPVLAFDRLRVNLSFFQLLTGVVGFEDIQLNAPHIRVDLLEDYSVNYARDWQAANPPAEEPGPEATDEASAAPQLYFQRVAIEDGELLFRDFSRGEVAEFHFSPLDLTLNDLATWRQADDQGPSNYSINATSGDQTVEWEGELSIAPFYSQGRIRLADIDRQTLSHFLEPVLPWQLREGSLTVESRYRMSASGGFDLVTTEGRVSLKEPVLALSESDDEPALSAGEIRVEGLGFDLAGRVATVGMVSLDQLMVAARRDAEGRIDWVSSLPASGSAAGREDSSASAPFRWSVQAVEFTDSGLRWRDQVPATPAEFELTGLNATLTGLSDRLQEPVLYQLSSDVASGGRLQANGQLTPAPFTFEGALSGSGILLSVAQPYLQQGANLEVRDGQLSFDGNLDLDDQNDPMTGTFSGTAQITDLDVRLPDDDGPLMSWQSLRLTPVEYNVYPPRLEIGTVTVASPSATIVRATSGLHNVQRVAGAPAPATAEVSEPEAAGNAQAQPGFIFRIGDLQIQDGAVSYTDRTLEPPFSTTFDALNGSVTGVSDVPPQQGRVNLRGELSGVAPVEFRGTLGALGTEEPSDLKLTMENLSLPVLSPYFGRYLGYAVDSGKMRLDLDYQITGTRLDASNLVVLDQMQLGQSVQSDQAISAPVKLGLALLTDRQGVIEVNLPVEGDLANPEFSVGQVVMRAFVNLLAKAAASPFTMLGSIADLAGFNSEELGYVAFQPGTTALSEEEAGKLSVLADALKERPELMLDIRGAFAPEADGLALLKEQMEARGEATTGDAWEQARQAYLAGDRNLPPEALGQLANRRALELRRILEQTHGVPSDQVFLLDISRDAGTTDQSSVVVPFNLDVR